MSFLSHSCLVVLFSVFPWSTWCSKAGSFTLLTTGPPVPSTGPVDAQPPEELHLWLCLSYQAAVLHVKIILILSLGLENRFFLPHTVSKNICNVYRFSLKLNTLETVQRIKPLLLLSKSVTEAEWWRNRTLEISDEDAAFQNGFLGEKGIHVSHVFWRAKTTSFRGY